MTETIMISALIIYFGILTGWVYICEKLDRIALALEARNKEDTPEPAAAVGSAR